ncbi:MAG: aminomethyl-transferring glycine dehydrogenase [Planctomycetota bacterium]|nr:aminomethyl-transferring glycine dehydrogenase [Planctomycetota bacterium]
MTTTRTTGSHPALDHPDVFIQRHLGPRDDDIAAMLEVLGYDSLDALTDAAVPADIRLERDLQVGDALSEGQLLSRLWEIAAKNEVWRSFIGLGYHECITPPVILRNILENPGWYTQYTPYQAEIAQGRLEMLLNFQTLITDLTGMEIANSSLLDEGTAVAEAMHMSIAVNRKVKDARFFVSNDLHPQSIAVLKTRAEAMDIELVFGDVETLTFDQPYCGVMVQYPCTNGTVHDYRAFAEKAHEAGALVIVAADPLALTLLTPPGEWGADVVVGSAQRFGVPLGYGGPHAGYLATSEAYQRRMPGRIVGVTRTQKGGTALRLALQTREQHIRREKATSNICTAQVLLAIIAAAYAIYHGPDGLKAIAHRVHRLTAILRKGLERLGFDTGGHPVFDTLKVEAGAEKGAQILAAASGKHFNLRVFDEANGVFGVTLDERTSEQDVNELLEVFAAGAFMDFTAGDLADEVPGTFEAPFARTSPFMTHPVFDMYRSETEMLRYLTRLQSKDLSLTTSMIPLGSCTMKLNATAEMMPITLPGFGRLHPFAPLEQALGYQQLFRELEEWLQEITGFAAISLQPNAGAQGEYTGMLVIRAYHDANGQGHRKICLIPESAHGTNPASAVMAGMKVVVVKCDKHGNIDLEDLEAKAEKHSDNLAAIMVTYPSTHGVFEWHIRRVCDVVHKHGGQVYLDGANLNAQLGLCRPGDYGADVCHLNLHKTFCIPHGGGGPGMGPIGVLAHLEPYLPTHPLVPVSGPEAIGPVSAAPWGSASILPISYAYIAMTGSDGLKRSSQVAILNANYMAKRLDPYFPVLYKAENGLCAHEFILDTRNLKKKAGVTVEDMAKRLMDYGFHAPTVSFPVIDTIMIEPTESESREELDRLCDALIAIHAEIEKIVDGTWPQDDNPLKNAPHVGAEIATDEWTHPYTREEAVYPAPWTREHKYWPPVKRADNVWGDRHLMCSCPPMEAYAEDA